MKKKNYKYLYGPVSSWRLGKSLGIDPVSQDEKICTFDCIYCQLGKAKPCPLIRKIFVPTEDILKEINTLGNVEIDYITFSGRGEPTLAENLGELIRETRKLRKEKIAVITNSTLINNPDVIKALSLADYVMLKLDFSTAGEFNKINQPASGINPDNIIQGIKKFNKLYKGKLALQIMFIAENKNSAAKFAELAKELEVDEVQLNTPLRSGGAAPLSKKEIAGIKKHFSGIRHVSVYDAVKKETASISSDDTLKRRGKEC